MIADAEEKGFITPGQVSTKKLHRIGLNSEAAFIAKSQITYRV